MTSQEVIDYMLGRATAGVPLTPSSSATKREVRLSPRKAVLSVSKALGKTLVDWLDTDDTAQRVVGSVANLRERLWHTSRQLLAQKQGGPGVKLWRHGGYRGPRDHPEWQLRADDLNLALDHDLRQHERMLSQLRHSLADLGATQEALGRRWDEYYRLAAGDDCCEHQPRGVFSTLDDGRSLFAATAMELYRKQMLAAQVLDSSNYDCLLCRDADGYLNGSDESNLRRVAHLCCEQWSRMHRDSYLVEYEARLTEMQQLARE